MDSTVSWQRGFKLAGDRNVDADTYTYHSSHVISLNNPWSTVQNLVHFLGSSFSESWSLSRPGSSSGLSSTQSHPSQLSTLPSGSPSSPSSRLCIWSPPWAPDSSRPTSREGIYSRSTPLRCTSLANYLPFVFFTRSFSKKSRESGSCMRFSIHTVLDSLHPVRFLQCLCRSVQQPAQVRTRSRLR